MCLLLKALFGLLAIHRSARSARSSVIVIPYSRDIAEGPTNSWLAQLFDVGAAGYVGPLNRTPASGMSANYRIKDNFSS